MQRLNYSKAPIIEAVIDVRVTPVEGFDVGGFDALCEGLQNDYPQRQFTGTAEVTFHFEPEVKAEHSQQRNGLALTSEDSSRALQVRLDGFTFSRRAPYSTWEEFRNEARRLWIIYRSCYPTTEITRIAHRAINRIDMPFEPGFELETYFKTFPKAPPDFPGGEMQGFFTQMQFWQPDLRCKLLLNQALVPPPDAHTLSIMLDFDLFREQFEEPWGMEQEAIAWDLLEELHVRRNVLFEASLTDQMKELLR